MKRYVAESTALKEARRALAEHRAEIAHRSPTRFDDDARAQP
jgi:hypothetical protein